MTDHVSSRRMISPSLSLKHQSYMCSLFTYQSLTASRICILIYTLSYTQHTFYDTLSYTFIHIHTLPYTFIHFHTLSYTFIHFHTLSYTFIHFHTHSYTFIYFTKNFIHFIHFHTLTIHFHTLSYIRIHVVVHLTIHFYTFYKTLSYILQDTFIHFIRFSHKINSPTHPPLYFNNQEVCSAAHHKHLGLILDSKLTFAKHISQKISIARKGIGIIKYMSSYAPTKTLDQIYKIFVRPHMDYCDIIYHLPRSTSTFDCPINLNFMMQSLESIQYQAALAVSGAWKGSSATKLYEELGWESLSDRRWLRRLCQFYKIQNDLIPSYLKEPIPQPRMFLYGQRRENVLHEIPCRTSRFLNSFYPDTIRSLNNIGYEFRNCSNLSKFKSKLLNLTRPPKKSIFDIHDPCGIKLLFQLRVGLSPLRHSIGNM